MTLTTRAQRLAIFRTYQRSPDGSPSYRTFRKRALSGYGCIMIQWCGMWLGIETDGYTHS